MSTRRDDEILQFGLALDDWGLSPGINEGILRFLPSGRVSSVSVMANMPYLSHRLEELLGGATAISLHLNFTEGEPVSPRHFVPSLCNRQGRFWGLKVFLLGFLSGRIKPEEVLLESEAQITRAKAFVGDRLTGLEGHHNIHLVPGILETLGSVLIQHHIRNVRTVESSSVLSAYLATRLLRFRFCADAQADPAWKWLPVFPLNPKDFRSSAALYRKLREKPGATFVAHPAERDDLEEHGSGDSLRERRRQLDMLLQCLPAAGERME